MLFSTLSSPLCRLYLVCTTHYVRNVARFRKVQYVVFASCVVHVYLENTDKRKYHTSREGSQIMTHACYFSSREVWKRFDGVVGYRICLTHRRSPVRTRVEPFFFSSPHPDSLTRAFYHACVSILKIRSSQLVNMSEINTSAVYPATVQGATTIREEKTRKTMSDSRKSVRRVSYTTSLRYTSPPPQYKVSR